MKKFYAVSAAVVFILAILVIFSGCIGVKGETYLTYTWTSSPLYLYDDNPSIPSTVYNGTYYQTEEGSFYMEYTAWDGSGWWMVYTITANPGELFFVDGMPAYFEIFLASFGPTMYDWGEYRSIENQSPNNSSVDTVAQDEPPTPEGRTDHGTETIVRGGYTMTIEWGPLE